ncbi:MAG: DegQ family serine endoprotease [Bdellovibrionales bacterium]|nr:DegQ family serine endoprotease [Bdellovibrionales bacterium]
MRVFIITPSRIVTTLFFSLVFLPLGLLSAQAETKPISYAEELSSAFQHVADTVTPSLVKISARSKPTTPTFNRGDLPDPFRDFFEKFGAPLPQGQQPMQALGSGVIVDTQGHILTNNHVVEGAEELTVQLFDDRSVKATLVGTDDRTDLAVIKIDPSNITPATLGDSNSLKIGEWVVAAGTPFGLSNTITAGIVSAKGRAIMGGNAYEDFIQTDAAINPGNSGGPLANLRGEVIGINTAIFSRSGGYMGIGFAIPINLAKTIMSSLISDGRVVRGWMGVGIQNLTEDLARSFDYPSTKGALVGHVASEGPAADAGIQQGDIIIRFDGHEMEDINTLRNTVAATKPGSKVEVDLIRDGRKRTVAMKLGELPDTAESGGTVEPQGGIPNLGLEVETLTPERAAQLGTQSKAGVLVRSVLPNSLAARAGLEPGDVVLQVGRTEVDTIREFERELTEDALKNGVRLIVETRGMQRYIFLKIE